MKKTFVIGVLLALALAGVAFGQKDKDNEPTSFVYFLVIKDDNGKPVRNAAVIMHAVRKVARAGDRHRISDVWGRLRYPEGED
jgi:hypothetical protein